MDYLNLAQLSHLCAQFDDQSLSQVLREAQLHYGIQQGFEGEEWPLLKLAEKLSEREYWKMRAQKDRKGNRSHERWMFGEYKIFLAVALLHARIRTRSLN